jgi:two-component system, sensor histidine kinase and response regulator
MKEKQTFILIVDDVPENLQVLGNFLRQNNYKTAVATNGTDALELIQNRIPDLILLDIMMPDMDGYEVCKKIKSEEKTREIPIIFISALSETVDKVKGFKEGGVDYITKPFQQEEVLARVNAHLTIRNLQKELLKQNMELAESEEKLKEALATKDKLFSIIAHDLRGPLGTIRSFLQIIVDEPDSYSPDDLKEFLSEMKKSSEKTFDLLENLLNWARSQRGVIEFKPEEQDLKLIIDENLNLLSSNAKRKSINLFTETDHPIIGYFDKNMITTVIRNLISNALKFTSPGGFVKVDAVETTEALQVSVTDNGLGIKDEDKPKLFQQDQNFTTKGTTGEKGTGLGLILCKDFVERNSGRIWAESEIGKGTNFLFTIPKKSV